MNMFAGTASTTMDYCSQASEYFILSMYDLKDKDKTFSILYWTDQTRMKYFAVSQKFEARDVPRIITTAATNSPVASPTASYQMRF